jgi:hypothetical protein
MNATIEVLICHWTLYPTACPLWVGSSGEVVVITSDDLEKWAAQ